MQAGAPRTLRLRKPRRASLTNEEFTMAITLHRDEGLVQPSEEQLGLECPYCGVYAHLSAQSVPDVDVLLDRRPKHVGLVYQCDACHAPVFLRFAIKAYGDDHVELFRDFFELERPKERFAFGYLPKDAETFFREALDCYSNGNYLAFATMCRRAANAAFSALGDGGKLRAFNEVMVAQRIAGIDDDVFDAVKRVMFDRGEPPPPLSRTQSGVLLEVLKDLFYQCFVRSGKLNRAIKVRRLFVAEGGSTPGR